MPRRSDHSHAQIRAMALAAARRLVDVGGLGDVTARRVAEAIGYSPGTLYNVFANLDDLILQVNAETLDDLRTQLAASPTGDVETDVKALALAYIAFIDAHPHRWAAVMDHSLPPGSPMPDWYQARIDALMACLECALAPLFGKIEEAARLRAASVLWSSLHGICSLSRSGKLSIVTADTVLQTAEDLVATYLAGLCARRRPTAP